MRAAARVLATVAVAAMLLWSATLIDPLGTVSNLVADILVGSVIVLVVRAVHLRRTRADVVNEISGDRANAIQAISEFVRAIQDSARGLLAEPMLRTDWSDPMFVLNEEGFHWRCDYVRANLRIMSGHHGGLDFGPHLEAIIAGGSRIWPLVELVGAGADPRDPNTTATEQLQEELDRTVTKLRALETLIAESYDPRKIAVLRHPDQFPPWLRRLFWVFAIAAGLAWSAAYLLSDVIPRSIADGTTNNVLTAGAAALVGTALIFVAQTSIRRRKIRSARPYVLGVVRGCHLLAAWLEGNVQGDARELIALVAEALDRNVERLQHIIADPLVTRYRRDLSVEILPFQARPEVPARPHDTDSTASVLRLSVERRLRLEATMDLLLERVISVYSDQEYFLNLDDEEILPADLFLDVSPGTAEPAHHD